MRMCSWYGASFLLQRMEEHNGTLQMISSDRKELVMQELSDEKETRLSLFLEESFITLTTFAYPVQ